MQSRELAIDRMDCQHCIMHVTKTLQTIDGVEVEDVQIGNSKKLCVEKKFIEIVLRKKIENAGYKLIGVQ